MRKLSQPTSRRRSVNHARTAKSRTESFEGIFRHSGGRALIPLAADRLLIHGGGTYMRYSGRLSQPGDYIRIACPVCSAKNGWGYDAQAGFSVAIARFQRFRLGVVSRVYRGYTNGEAIGAVPGIRTRDHWMNTMAEFGIAF